MKNCNYCGVELEKNMNFCPLCGEPVMDENTDHLEYIEVRKRKQEENLLTDYQKLTKNQKRKLFWQISGIILLSGILVTLILDFIGNQTITWSRYTIAICAVLFLNTTMINFWYKKIPLLLIGSFISTSALLLLLDIFHGTIGWGVKLGAPILFAAYVIVFILISLIKAARKRGLNIIAYCLIASGLLSICTEGIISVQTMDRFHIDWSIIVMASVLLVAILLLFIHHRLKKVTDLKRFFHI
jgi:hypothetical protein